jgi:plastocyanin
LLVAGCDEKSGKPAATAVAKTKVTGPSASGGFGTILGTVSLKGEPPAMAEIPNQPCHAGATPLRDETVVADDRGHLANVVVFLNEAPKGPSRSTEPAVMDQVNCRYVPHILALRTGQALKVKTSDPAVHNVHAVSSLNPAKNFSMQPGSPPVDLRFEKAEEFGVRCDVHPWMSAKVHVFDHGCFAVTKPDGTFTMNDVPAGQYTMVFRHELFGDVEEVVTVADKHSVTQDAVFEKPGK